MLAAACALGMLELAGSRLEASLFLSCSQLMGDATPCFITNRGVHVLDGRQYCHHAQNL